MPASYPTSAKSFTTKSNGAGNTIDASHVNDLQLEVTAIETDLIAGLPVARGGTGGTSAPTAGGLVYGNGTAFAFTAAGSAGQIPISGGAGAPTFGPTPVQGGVMYGGSATHAYSTAGTAGQLVVSGGTGAPTFLNPPLVLLKANSGTTTNASAENVDTVSITGLTANDVLVVQVLVASVTQATASIQLYNNTDGVTVAAPDSGAAIAIAETLQSTITAMQSQNSATSVSARSDGYSNNGERSSFNTASFTTNWTGTWTLALRQGGVTAGGTLRWKWTVFKVAGQ